ncbi:MAG: outer membrane protein assembly factor BamC [Methylococcales bacterium]|nr:outer membrane protein assembly factor BamC [Methylococcales bacterium]
MKHKHLIRLTCAAVLVQLSACTTIKEAFPDKEKDYQFTTEITKLIIPADLASGSNLSGAVTRPAPVTTTETTPATTEAEKKPAEEAASTDTAADEQPFVESKSVTVELLEASHKVSYLRIGTPFLRAWRIVSKGLSRKSIEVSDRNQEEKIFTVQYDPDEQPVEDGSYVNEIDFILHGFQGNEKEYKLKLVETNQQTDVVILNEEQKPTSDEAGLKLLRVLEKSIKANLAGT